MGEFRNADKVGLEACEDSIKMGLDEVMCQSELCACSDEHSVFIEAGRFLITWLNTYFSRKALYAVDSCN
jgi:hypothetical protein